MSHDHRSQSEQERIVLAKAMGINFLVGELTDDLFDLPDPFTNANDDYAVLEWMRRGEGDAQAYTLFKRAFSSQYVDSAARWYLYEIGDYAKAALTVVNRPSLEKEQ